MLSFWLDSIQNGRFKIHFSAFFYIYVFAWEGICNVTHYYIMGSQT